MNALLKLALEAHGGLARWQRHATMLADLSVSGAIWQYKQNPGLLDRTTVEAGVHAEHVILRPFSAPDKHTVFEPGSLTLMDDRGTVVASRDNPRTSFDGHQAETPWDDFHVAYFSSYALWTYLSTPFLYTYPGFVTEEIAPWEENGEVWRRLKVTFPPEYESHTREQITHFGSDGLVRRHDYTVDVLGGATGANYAFDYKDFDGIKVPTTRRVYAYDATGQKIPEPLLVAIDIHDVKFI